MDESEQTANEGASNGPLNFLTPRETARAVKARGSRRIVSRLRVLLPIMSVLALLGLILWPMINPDHLVSKVLKNAPDLVIKDLNFTDYDSKKEPYSISAAEATRPSGDQNVYDLKLPQGEITLQQGAWIAVKSEFGRYDKDHNQLWLGGNVQIFHDKGYEFTTDELQADLIDHTAWGEKPVLIQGDFGEIRGTGFRLLDSGNIFVVKGPAKALLNLRQSQASDKPTAAK